MTTTPESMYGERAKERVKRRERLHSKGVDVDMRLTLEEAQAIADKVFIVTIPNSDELDT
ncbi:hypothetical protein ACFL3T_01560 [Patescibacteria group bacterium]